MAQPFPQHEDCGGEGRRQANERELPPGTGDGYLWRLYSYWRYEERDGGTWVECEAISLTRDIPRGWAGSSSRS